MGLSIHIKIASAESRTLREMREAITRWHDIAKTMKTAGRVDEVLGISNASADLTRFATHWLSVPHPSLPDTTTGVPVLPIEGSMFLVRVGEGCEPLALGLCRYPDQVKTAEGEYLTTDLGKGWHFQTSCKTQYASKRGWDHFFRSHASVIDLADAASSLGLHCQINDEGGYWPDRNESALRASLKRINTLMAGFAGALKDELSDDAEASGGASNNPLTAAIFEHPDFERLEADAQTSDDAAKITEALRKIREEMR